MNDKFTIFDILDLVITLIATSGAAIVMVTVIYFLVPDIL